MLFMFAEIPKHNNATKSDVILFAEFINNKHDGYNIDPTKTHFLLVNLETKKPEIGIVISCPNGKANKIEPKSDSESFNAVRISAMRFVQVAKITPCIKKNALVASLKINI